MGRVLILFLPLLILAFGGGVLVGRAGKRKAIVAVSSSIRPVLAAARGLVDVDWLDRPADASLKVTSLRLALDEYDHEQRTALL